MCGKGYHTFCLGLQYIPPGMWNCDKCNKEIIRNTKHHNSNSSTILRIKEYILLF